MAWDIVVKTKVYHLGNCFRNQSRAILTKIGDDTVGMAFLKNGEALPISRFMDKNLPFMKTA